MHILDVTRREHRPFRCLQGGVSLIQAQPGRPWSDWSPRVLPPLLTKTRSKAIDGRHAKFAKPPSQPATVTLGQSVNSTLNGINVCYLAALHAMRSKVPLPGKLP
jgi:hypothetical protein